VRKRLLVAVILLIISGTFWFVSTRSTRVKIAGELNAQVGTPAVTDGYYDMRIVTYDSSTGQFLEVKDYADVSVEGGLYVVDYTLPRKVSEKKVYYQLCRSSDPTVTPDGFDASNLPVRCESLDKAGSSLPVVECPKTLVVDKKDIFGNASSYATPDCIEDETTIAHVDFAGSNTEKQAVQAIFGERGPAGPKGEKGDQGEPGVDGKDGSDGTNGVDGATGAQGVAGDPATDDQTLSFDGVSILSISEGNSISLSALLDNTDSQDLSRSGNTLSLTGDSTTVDLTPYLDNTDTLTSLSCMSGQVAQWNGSAWICASAAVDTDDQTVSYVSGTQTLSIVDGNSISLASLLDNTDSQSISLIGNTLNISGNVSTVDLSPYLDNTDSQNLFLTIATPDANNPTADSQTDTLTFANGTGVAITSNGATDTITIATTLGTDIDSAEIADGTIAFTDIASNSCGTNDIFKFNGSAWYCGTDVDTDTTLSEANVEAYIFDADNTGTLSSGTLALGSLSYTGTLTDTNIADALTISSGGSVADGALSVNVSLFGSSVDSSEITNGTVTGTDLASATILFSNIAQNGCSSQDIMKWNGSAWDCATDVDTDTDSQNLFATINADNGTDPSADSSTDTLNFVSGTGVTITGDGTTDTITVAATLGTDISSAEIVDETIVSADISDGSIANADLANSSITVTAGTGLTSGGAVSLGGTVTLNASLGTDITSGEIVDGTITFADLASNSCNSGEIFKYNGSAWYCGTDIDTTLDETAVDGFVSNNGYLTSEVDGSTTNELQNLFLTIATPDANNPTADSQTDTLTFANGTGVAITSNGATDTITIATTLGTDIDSAEIADGTIAFTDIASNSCGTNDIFKFNGSAWYCGTDVDTDTTLSEANVEAYIFDADNTGTLSSGTLALGSLSYTGTLTDTNIADALTISSGGSVADGALSVNVSLFGSSVDSSEITNGTVTGTDLASATILFSNIAQNGCSSQDIMKWNGSAWDCATDVDTDTDSQNLFATINADNGTDPSADSSTDTLNFVSGTGVTITGDGTTDTITVAATLGTDISSAEIVDETIVSADISDGSIANADLANSSITVTAGTGLTSGGAVSLGGTVTLNASLGTDITSGEIVDGTITFADLASNSCNSGEIFKYNGSAWYCGTDIDTTLDETAVDGFVSNNGYLTSEVDGSTTNELQNLFLTIATPDANNPTADSQTDTLTFANGTGVAITSNGATDTITIATTLGTDIDSAEIADGTIAFTDIASNSCGTNDIFKFNGSAWYCGTDVDTDTTLSEANVEAYIFDADNTGTLSSGTLALGSLSYTGTLTDTNIADALTISSGGSVADGALSVNVSLFGSSVDSSEITNGTVTGTDLASATILFSNIAQNGCSSQDIMKWNGSAWDCATDVDTDTDSQNLFATINADNGTDPSADSSTDTLNFVSGTGVTITGDGTTDTITVAATLGTDISSAEIVDETIVSADISDGSIANADLANSSITVTAGTGLTSGGAVSLGGTVTLNASLGTDITSGEIVDGTITFADLASNSCNSGEIFKYNGSAWYCGTDIDTTLDETAVDGFVSNNGYLTSEVDGSTTNELQNLFLTIATPDANNPTADSQTDTLTFANGTGVAITSNGATDTITIATTLGTDIDSAEIADGTIAFTDIASNSCGTNDIFKFNGSAWYCGTDVDTDTTLSEANVEAYIFDADNTGTLSSGTLALGSLSYTGTLTDTNIADALTISSGGSVADGALSVNVSLFGSSVDSSEITNGTVTGTDLASATILFSNIAQNGCSSQDIMKWNGSAWDCATDVDTDTDSQNLFATINADNGTDPSADSSTDTLNFVSGTGVTITGDGTTDTITVAATLGTDISSAEIVDETIVSADISDGSIANADLANSSITVTAGTGLTSGGAVSLGGTVTLNASLGTDITSGEIVDGTITFADLASNSCNSGEIFKYNGSAWYCGTDIDTTLDETAVDGFVSNNGYLTSEVDGSTTNELQNLFLTIATPDANNPTADSQTDTLTFANGTGVAITSNGATDTITIATTLGTDIDSAEIADGTIAFTDIASNSCGTNDIFKFNGSAWYCGTDVDTDTTLSEANVEAYIFDADNTGTLSSGTLALGSLSYTGTLTDTNIADALTISSGGSVADGALSVNVSLFGSSVDSSEITNGTVTGTDLASATILFSNIAQNGCSSQDIMKWNGSAWDCATDVDTDTDSQNLFATINADNGTDPSADSSTDTLNFVSGTGVTITGDGTTDTITVAATLGTDISSAEIVDETIVSADISDGSIANADLANSSITVTAGTGLTSGGAVSLGGTVTLNASLGTDITSGEIVDGTITFADLASNSCNSGEIFKYNGSAWYCGTDIDTTLDETAVDGFVSNNGYLTSEVDGSTTNELQNLFLTIATPDANNPTADSQTDTLTFANGTGVAITSNGATDTITIATTLGTDIDSAEIADGTIAFTDIASNSCGTNDIFKFNGSAWYCGTDVDTDTTLSEANVEAYIFDADNTGTLSSGTLALGSLSYTGTLTDTNIADALTISSGGSVADGALSVNVSLFGSSVDSSEITNGTVTGTDLASATILFSNIAQNGCSSQDIMKWNGSAWDCATDVDTDTDSQNLFATINADNGTDPSADSSTDTLNFVSGTGVTITGDGTTDTITVAATLGTDISSAEIVDETIVSADISDGSIANADLANSSITVTAGTGLTSGGAVSLGGTVTLNASLGTDITSGEIVDGTIVATDVAGNVFVEIGRSSAQTDSSTNSTVFVNKTGVSGNLVQLQAGAVNEFVVGFDGTIDTASVDGTSIIDGSVANGDLANSSVTVTAGSGLTTGGAVSLGGTVTLDVGAGTGITVNANDIAITADGLNFTELSDTLSLDASTTISLGANNFTTNLNSTGDFAIQFGGNTVLSILDTGAVTIGNILADQAIGLDNGTGTINIATDSDVNTTNIGTGSGADTVNVGDSNANVVLTDANWSITGAGAANFSSTTGSGLTDCDTQTSKLLWDSSTGQFSCGTDRASAAVRKSANETVTSSTALQDDNELLFAAGTSETWVYQVSFIYTTGSSGTPDIRVGMNGPAGSTCVYQASDIAHAGNASAGVTACNTSISLATTATGTKGGWLSGSVTTAGTSGNIAFRWAQNTSSGTSTVVSAGSSLTAFKLTGADYAETYYSNDATIRQGELVSLTGDGRSQVERSGASQSDRVIGIVSTQPGQIVGAADGVGYPVQIALMGRVPIKLSTENGLPKAGDMIAPSASYRGLGMKATQSGYIVGQLMMDATDNGDGTADGFVFIRSGYWQAPIAVDFSDIFGAEKVAEGQVVANNDTENIGLQDLTNTDEQNGPVGFDQSLIDAIRSGFSIQQSDIDNLSGRIAVLETGLEDIEQAINQYFDLSSSGISILKDTVFSGDVTFDKPIRTPNSAGSAVVPAQEKEVLVEFKNSFSTIPNIVISPNEFIEGMWRVKETTNNGFVIELSEPQIKDVHISWQAVLTE
jgi:predicted transporter